MKRDLTAMEYTFSIELSLILVIFAFIARIIEIKKMELENIVEPSLI